MEIREPLSSALFQERSHGDLLGTLEECLLQPRSSSLAASKKALLAFKFTFNQLVSPVEVSQVIAGWPQVFHIYSNQSSYALFVDVICPPVA